MLQAEFGGPIPINLLSYYRGGGLVPNSAINANVPTSGPITIPNHFWGASNLAVALSSHSIIGYQQSEPNPFPPPAVVWDNAAATFTAFNDGTARGVGSNGTNGTGTNDLYPGEWLVSGNASDFEIMATVTSGSVSGGSAATGVWLNLGTTRFWHKVYAGVGGQTAVILVQIRPVGGAVMASGSMTLTATRG